MSDTINRIKEYTGKSMNAWENKDKKRPTNPNITARDTIEIANYIMKLENKILELHYEIYMIKEHKYL